ncbi:hypothetical protein Q5424_14640 [Conexibacter sp. JD483]|uniref:hypothetical protein n=1 Tax=unclassified Conexibacter TaxID=2627773 RepID=UPI00271F8651|nr:MULTISPECIES: hypothetical protein [unclassified Conexibacter]MDO8187589.1 hypothetical protein [Conexibacter sp. CPCC 205706]MDO8198955.1 hypothetical protein [Conexibacter sp. CPCC 205762]MDR9370338.1 hypothetical protein [Conexibacter sp. JD483]
MAAATLLLVVVVVVLVVRADDGVDCSGFAFDAGAWQRARADRGGDPERAREIATGIAECGLVDGRTAAEVSALLGPPNVPGDPWEYWIAEGEGSIPDDDFLEVTFGTDAPVPVDARVRATGAAVRLG